MTTTLTPLAGLIAAIVAFLGAGSLASWLLHARTGSPARARLARNLSKRVRAWWLMAAILGLAFVAGKAGIVLLCALLSILALREFLALTGARPADHGGLALLSYGLVPLQYALIWFDRAGIAVILLPVYGFLALPVLTALKGDVTDFFGRTAKIQFAAMLCVYALSYLAAPVMLDIGPMADRLGLIAWAAFTVQMSDVLQYVCGKLIGRHPVAPALSPAKTWEGLVGGVALTVLLAILLHGLTPFGLWRAGLIALTLTLAGFLGGLVMSAIKRDRGLKDWGRSLPGHGGLLDRLDSLLFSAPLLYHITNFWWG
ncbi:MAG: phosphatidate cytidylyltransferase [Rhodothalassiaceae bacterium]